MIRSSTIYLPQIVEKVENLAKPVFFKSAQAGSFFLFKRESYYFRYYLRCGLCWAGASNASCPKSIRQFLTTLLNFHIRYHTKCTPSLINISILVQHVTCHSFCAHIIYAMQLIFYTFVCVFSSNHLSFFLFVSIMIFTKFNWNIRYM